ncbi:MAG: MFS transporter [Candidatus Dormibacterales bacterium]
MPAWFGWAASQALFGWLVFDATESPALVSVAFALRLLPLAIAGVPVGALSDRLGRIRILQGSNLLAAAIATALAAIAWSGRTELLTLLVAAAAFGLADSGRLVSGNNLVFDLAGGLGTTRAVAASNFVAGIGVAIGGGAAGQSLSRASPAVVAVAVALAYAASAALMTGVSEVRHARPAERPSFAASLGAGLAMLREVPVVGGLIGLAFVVEVFAFSAMALDPVFAGKVFTVGPAGLGLIIVARAGGRLCGSGILVLSPPQRALGRVLTFAVVGFGIALVTYAVAPRFQLALPLVLGAGVASVLVDALVLTALQTAVEHGSRGRAAGLWVLIVGLQPIGVLEVGLVAQFLGARDAQLLNGLIVGVFGLVLVGTGLGRRIREIEARDPGRSGPSA